MASPTPRRSRRVKPRRWASLRPRRHILLLTVGSPRGKQSAQAVLTCAPLVVCLNYWGIPLPHSRANQHTFFPLPPKNTMITPCSFFPFGITYHCPATAFSHRESLPSAAPPPFAFLVACGIVCGTTPVPSACGPRAGASISLSKLFQEDLFE